jgi:two-component system sensor histidine kinase MprB
LTWPPSRLRRLREFRSLPLRTRMAMLTAVAVAMAVAAVAVAAWFLTRAQLLGELDDSLHSVQAPKGYIVATVESCTPDEGAPGNEPPYFADVQVVKPDGSACVGQGSKAVKVQPADIDVARGDANRATHDSTTVGGEPVRVYTFLQNIGPPGHELVPVSISRPLSEVTDPLGTLALILAIVAGIGVLGATSAGLVIARAGLRPVDRLTDAVEHIARTEDLAVRIPVDGEDEIARLSAAFNSMTARLASSRERQQQLIADAGHELRTPLTSLRTNIDLLARSERTGRPIPPDDRRALMQSVKAQITELASLIGDLQELARPDAAPDSAPPEFVAVHEVAEQAVARARLRGPDLIIKADLAPWYVKAEPASLERALVNLLDNAVKFSPAGGTIDVALADGSFSVRDRGPGIPAEDLPHVFERFWRSPSARSLPGSGLGLSIVARTVERAGGTVTLSPAPGGGTLAHVTLPGAPTAPPGLPE